MAHELEQDDWMVSGNGIVPWHGIGSVVDGAMTAQEALEAAKLAGWNLTKKPVYIGTDVAGQFAAVPRFFAVVRETDNKSLGIVQQRYEILQNEQAFDWADFLVGGGGCHYETAGSLRGGRIVFLTLKTPYSVELPGGDTLETFLLISNRHDGSGAVQIAIVTVRVVCKNTLDMSLGAALGKLTIKHTASMEAKLGEAQKVLGLAQGAANRAEEIATKLLATKLTETKFTRFVNLLTVEALPSEPSARALKAAEKVRDSISEVYYQHPTQEAIKGTAWGAYNAVTFYNDHLTKRRDMGDDSDGTPAENRMQAILTGNNVGTKALALLTKDLGGGRWLK